VHKISVQLTTVTSSRSLSLVHFSVRRAQLASATYTILQDIRAVWPQLRELKLNSTTVAYEDLLRVSEHLPQLRHLYVKLGGAWYFKGPLDTLHVPPAFLETRGAVWLSHLFTLTDTVYLVVQSRT
jgi:hypothetical protein